jgi:hypothetical protein
MKNRSISVRAISWEILVAHDVVVTIHAAGWIVTRFRTGEILVTRRKSKKD